MPPTTGDAGLIPIEAVLPLAGHGVLSLTGGGGKTSLMFHLARLLAGRGARVLTTTTTKIFYPTPEQAETVLVDADPERILRRAAPALKDGVHVTAAALPLEEGRKLKGFPPEAISLLAASGLFDWILVEADGSARRPLKAPAGHEPVIPGNTDILLAVAGLQALGCPVTEDVVFRSSLAGERMGLAEGEIITEAAMARLISHPLGAFQGAPAAARRFLFLNQADDQARRRAGARIAARLRQKTPVAEAVIVGQALEAIRVHAFHLLEEIRCPAR